MRVAQVVISHTWSILLISGFKVWILWSGYIWLLKYSQFPSITVLHTNV